MQKAKWNWPDKEGRKDEYVHFIDEFIVTDNSNVTLSIGESDFDGAGSLCHGWSAMPVYYYNILKVE